MDDLLEGFEKEFDIEESDEEDLINQAKVVAELNLLKQTSSQLLDQDKKRQTRLKSNLSVDKYMDADTVLETRKSVER